ncbi:CoA transferase [Brevibacillus nitrificans]|uniref:CoA transferase n=1 Tax=Brevibacillus nitrificans TaxID=651560 RepID=UPI00285DA3B9|nr:CoA transferase [Brevibacillus nitrificans]MDR7316157.1 crotonobetainyl-CoA:carnitine CoA-transferase CaiB-like acyl-CoA transferase [Brevibacillus nitrificans]
MGPYFEEESYSFMMANRNKRGIRLNIKEEAGREILYDLVRSADVFIENYRPGVTKKLGIDYETLRRAEPRLDLLLDLRVRTDRAIQSQGRL